MNIDEFLELTDTSARKLARQTELGITTIMNIKKGVTSPSLFAALKLHDYSAGEIELEDLLSDKDLEKWESYLVRKYGRK